MWVHELVRGEGSSYLGRFTQAMGKAYNNIYFRKHVQAGEVRGRWFALTISTLANEKTEAQVFT